MTTKSAALSLDAPMLPACVDGIPELPKSVDSGNLAFNRLVTYSIGCRSKNVRRGCPFGRLRIEVAGIRLRVLL